MAEDEQPVVVALDSDELAEIMQDLEHARSARFVIQDGGLKVSIDRQRWSLPLGRQEA